MSNTEIFHRIATQIGYSGRVEWDRAANTSAGKLFGDIAAQANELIDSARQHLPRLKPIHFDFACSGKINAFACKENDQYFIGVTSGTIFLLQLIFCRMLSDSQLFTHMGQQGIEHANQPLLIGLVPDAQQMFEAGTTIRLPTSDDRSMYSRHLLSQACLFLIGHEIAHITRGHVDYLNSKTETPCLQEMGWNPRDPVALLERQALEVDADRRSFNARLGSMRSTATTCDQPDLPWLNAASTLEQLVFDCTFAINSLFRIFGDIRFAGADLSAASYPPLPLRRAMLVLWAASAAPSDMKESAKETLKRATLEAESAFATITGQHFSADGFNDTFRPEGRAHMQRLADCWSERLQKQLAPFSLEPD